jgi:lipoprotein-releasing system permease protein
MVPTLLAVMPGVEIIGAAGALVLLLMLGSLGIGAPFRPFLAILYLKSRPIHLIGALGIAVAVWALVLVVSIFDGYIVEMRRHIRGTASDLSLVFIDLRQPFAPLAKALHSHPEVRSVAPRFAWYALLEPVKPRRAPDLAEHGSNFFQVVGIDAKAESELRGFRDELLRVADPELRVADPDRPFAPLSGQADLPRLLLGVSRAESWGLRRGDVFLLTTTTQRAALAGEPVAPRRFVLAGCFDSDHFEFEDGTVFVPIDELRRPPLVEPEDAKDACNEVAIALRDGERASAVRQELLDKLEARGLSGSIVTWEERPSFQRFLENVEHQKSLMTLVLFVLMVVSCFLIFATLLMTVSEKTRDIGILAALGATRGGVLMVFLTCGLVVSAAGASAGALTGALTCLGLNDFNDWLDANLGLQLFPKDIYNLDRVPYLLAPMWLALVCTCAVLGTLAFSLVPAWLAARKDPVQSLRAE